MPGRLTPLVNGEIYHLFNRGSDKRDIFLEYRDYLRFKQTLYYYHFLGPKPRFSHFPKYQYSSIRTELKDKIVEIICYCLMPNHFHLLVRQLKDNGISKFISQISNSYTKYFNTKYRRVGPLLQGLFKAVRVESDEQLIHLSRYIHLNPVVSLLVKRLRQYPWSSYPEYANNYQELCSTELILNLFPSKKEYVQFLEDQIDYGKQLELIKHQVIEEL